MWRSGGVSRRGEWRRCGGGGAGAAMEKKSWSGGSGGSGSGRGGGGGGSGGSGDSSSGGDREEIGESGEAGGVPAWLTRGLESENLAVWVPQDWTAQSSPAPMSMVGVGSYNWDCEAWLPTIVVPGRAKVYGRWKGGLLEVKDEEMVADEDTFRNPLAPMEPLMVATRLLSPALDINSIHLIADLNSLKHLARFLLGFPDQGYPATGAPDSFRLGLQTLGSIIGEFGQGPVVLIRHEERFTAKWIGYGAAFVRACLRPPLAKELGGPFKQVSLLVLGSLRILVRHKISAVRLQTEEAEAGEGMGGGVKPASSRHGLETSLRVRANTFPPLPANSQRIIFGSLGLSCDRLSLEKWLDLLFTQASHLCLGRHMRGDFKRTEWLTEEGVKRLLPPAALPNLHPHSLCQRLERLLSHLCHRTIAASASHDLALLLHPNPPNQSPKLLLRVQTRRDLASVSPALVRQILHPAPASPPTHPPPTPSPILHQKPFPSTINPKHHHPSTNHFNHRKPLPIHH